MSELDQPDIGVMVSTRFGVGVKDVEWLEHRFMLFEAITAPSLRAQTHQDFIWNIFIGEDAYEWVFDRLQTATQGIGSRVIIHRSSQKSSYITQVADRYLGSVKRLLALIDDDDAWRTSMLECALKVAIDTGNEVRKAFTFPYGIEFLPYDLVDMDLLAKSKLIVTHSSGYSYFHRPFHSMSCFLLYSGECPDFRKLHSTLGESMRDQGFSVVIEDAAEPMWIYTRHKQASSSYVKARKDNFEASVSEIELNDFGISVDLLREYVGNSDGWLYAREQNHKKESSRKATILQSVKSLDDVKASSLSDVDCIVDDCILVGQILKFRILTKNYYRRRRVAFYDLRTESYVKKVEFSYQVSVALEIGEGYEHQNLRFKIQWFDERNRVWVDSNRLVALGLSV